MQTYLYLLQALVLVSLAVCLHGIGIYNILWWALDKGVERWGFMGIFLHKGFNDLLCIITITLIEPKPDLGRAQSYWWIHMHKRSGNRLVDVVWRNSWDKIESYWFSVQSGKGRCCKNAKEAMFALGSMGKTFSGHMINDLGTKVST